MSWNAILACGIWLPCSQVFAQEVLTEMPRYDRYRKLSTAQSYVSGAANVQWSADGKSVRFTRAGKVKSVDLLTGTVSEAEATTDSSGRRNSRGIERGRQSDTAVSGDWTAGLTPDRNIQVWKKGEAPKLITTDGSVEKRIKNGIASWVYGEELGVQEAMWWSPNAENLAYYRFDETNVKDYYLALKQVEFQAELDTEAYPKAGTLNPVVALKIWNRSTGKTIVADTKFDDANLGEYVYSVRWSPDGRELLFNRTNRKQNVMQLCAIDSSTGKGRVVMEEKQPQSWAENNPDIQFQSDQRRFIWSTERNGYKNFFLADLQRGEINKITSLTRDALSIVKVDEGSGQLFYLAAGSKNPYFDQLHVAKLDGTGDRVLTDPDFHHTVSVSPDGKHFTTVRQRPDYAPETVLYRNLKEPLVIAASDLTEWKRLGLRNSELFTYKAADGKTDLYGTVQFPSDFDPNKKYPVILSVYAGPESGGPRAQFSAPSPVTELGFLVVNLAGRGTMGRGKAFRDAVYGKLGVVEIDDQAAGIKHLATRPYVDSKNVGVYGTSYGGYASIMLLLRHPEVFRTACASSSVTDWRHYDTIYTERYQGLPTEGENKVGYDAGSAMTYAKDLKGNLMLFFGSADNNVHPSNTYMLIRALDRAGKRYDMQVGPDVGHAQMNSQRMWEYFMKTLVLYPQSKPQANLVPGGLRLRQKQQIG
jgi:dipeptidyl-peptidase-4